MTPPTDLIEIGRLDDVQVGRIEKGLREASGEVCSTSTLLAVVAERLGGDGSGTADDVVRNLVQLHQFAHRYDRSVAKLVGDRREGLRQAVDAPWDKDEALRGLEIVERLATAPAVRLAAKAIDLLYDCDNLLQRTRVLTDVRPLFSDDARRVEGAVVAHTLRVRYDHAGRDEEISFSLDAADLRRLIDHCERGLLKEATARRELPERADIPTTPAAEPDDAAD